MHIRNATQHDAKALSELAIITYTQAFGHSMSASDLAAHVAQHLLPNHFEHMLERDTFLVAEIDGCLIGFVQFGTADLADAHSGDADQELRRLYVRAECHNQGIGSGLIEHALKHPNMQRANQIFLDVWQENNRARRLYERYGFRVIGERPFAVESGAETTPDLIMVRRAGG